MTSRTDAAHVAELGIEGAGRWFVTNLLVPLRNAMPSIRFLTTANAVTVIRLLLFYVPGLYFFHLQWYGTAGTLITISVLLDIVDGWIARKDGPTVIGAWLDSTADKCVTIPLFYLCSIHGMFHDGLMTAIGLILIIDLCNFLLNTFNLARARLLGETRETGSKNRVKSGNAGKLKMWACSIAVIAVIYGHSTGSLATWQHYLGWYCTCFAILFAFLSLENKLALYKQADV